MNFKNFIPAAYDTANLTFPKGTKNDYSINRNENVLLPPSFVYTSLSAGD